MRAERSYTLTDSLSLFCSPVPSFLLLTVMTGSEIDECRRNSTLSCNLQLEMWSMIWMISCWVKIQPQIQHLMKICQLVSSKFQQRQIPPALPAFLAQQQQHHVLPQMPAPPQMQAMPAPPQMQALHAHQMSTPPQMPAPPQMLTLMPPPYAPPNRHLVDILKDLRLIKRMLNSLVNQRQVLVNQKNYRKIISNTFTE